MFILRFSQALRSHSLVRSSGRQFRNNLLQILPERTGATTRVTRLFCEQSTLLPGQRRRQKLLYLGTYKEQLLKCAQTKDFATAKLLYEKFTQTGVNLNIDAYERLISTCHKAEHLPQLNIYLGMFFPHKISLTTTFSQYMQMFLDRIKGHPMTETSHLACVRCQADSGNIDECMSLLEAAQAAGTEVKLRFMAPIFNVLKKS